MKKNILAVLFFSTGLLAFGQESENEGSKKFPEHTLGLVLSHANISTGVSESGGRKWLSIPAWGLDYNCWFTEKWALGLHTDFIIEKIEVKENLNSDEAILERSYPIAPALMGIYKPTKHSSFLFGMGAEFAKEENLVLNRVGYEWSTEIGEKWELGLSFNYDFRWNAYDSYTLGFGISRNLSR
ncbi:hypothetical protein [Flavobacterium agrisoli]|uniref:Uncharacterized protein n=1 Tax=Flavobacterium agrisoli TaxID=2793066 RepID=A0A934PMU8_9FLAO|nr:hypothetical protein [Flavobacterium agrisoli]MBK0369724.1 hypothetical protein [Flavobacterium agrisoli]